MLKKILLTLDGSENAEKAVPWAKQFAAREHAQVVLLRVVPPTRDRQEAREYLLRMERELNYLGIATKVLVRRGNPAREIVDAAKDQGCDLIVISTRGGSKVKRWVMGGVTVQKGKRSMSIIKLSYCISFFRLSESFGRCWLVIHGELPWRSLTVCNIPQRFQG